MAARPSLRSLQNLFNSISSHSASLFCTRHARLHFIFQTCRILPQVRIFAPTNCFGSKALSLFISKTGLASSLPSQIKHCFITKRVSDIPLHNPLSSLLALSLHSTRSMYNHNLPACVFYCSSPCLGRDPLGEEPRSCYVPRVDITCLLTVMSPE